MHVDVIISEMVKLIEAIVVGLISKPSVQTTKRSVTVVFCASSHFSGSGLPEGRRLVGIGPEDGPQPPSLVHWGPPQI
jgi:hypothetical protein